MNAFTITEETIVNQLLVPADIVNPLTGERFKTVALWDTGAASTVITSKIAARLGLTITGTIVTKGLHAKRKVCQYHAAIHIGDIRLTLPVTECSKAISPQVECVIGMDIISQGDMALTNHGGRTTLTFRIPSQGNIDFIPDKSI